MRIGLASQYQITNQLILTPEVAYIPLVSFNGLDSHNARQLLGPESSSQGDGTMVETSLDYQLNETWSVGLGGRYWAWNMRSGSVLFDFLGNSEEDITELVLIPHVMVGFCKSIIVIEILLLLI